MTAHRRLPVDEETSALTIADAYSMVVAVY